MLALGAALLGAGAVAVRAGRRSTVSSPRQRALVGFVGSIVARAVLGLGVVMVSGRLDALFSPGAMVGSPLLVGSRVASHRLK